MSDDVKCVDLNAEATYVTAALTQPNTVLEHPIAVEDVSSRPLRLALAAISAIVQRRHELTTHSLVSELERMGMPPAVAGEIAIDATSGPIGVPATAAKRLRELGEMRRTRAAALRLIEACEGHQLDDARGMRAAIGRDFEAIGEVSTLTFRQMLETTVESVSAMGTERDRAVRLGTPKVDNHWHPYPGSLTVVGAATGTGKSTLLTQWSLSMAKRGIANGIVSAEDPAEDFGSKMMGELSHVDPGQVWRGKASGQELRRFFDRSAEHANLPLAFSYVGSRRIDDVLAAMRIQARKHGARVIAVDYLQTITPRSGAGRDVREKTDAVLAELIVEATALGVALVLASQLRRPDRESPEPTVTALKESGTIENRAQAIVLLWRDDKKPNDVFGKLAKVKRGPSGVRFRMTRDPDTGALVQVADEGDPDFGAEEPPEPRRNGQPYRVGGWQS